MEPDHIDKEDNIEDEVPDQMQHQEGLPSKAVREWSGKQDEDDRRELLEELVVCLHREYNSPFGIFNSFLSPVHWPHTAGSPAVARLSQAGSCWHTVRLSGLGLPAGRQYRHIIFLVLICNMS